MRDTAWSLGCLRMEWCFCTGVASMYDIDRVLDRTGIIRNVS